jgi:hypothetical protein
MLSQHLIPVTTDADAERWENSLSAAHEVEQLIKNAMNDNKILTAELLQELIHPLVQIAVQLPDNNNHKADKWTISQAVFECIGTLLRSTLWISTMIDDGIDPEAKALGNFSWIGLGTGFALSILLALAEMQCHKIINIVNQNSNATLLQAPTKDTKLTKTQKVALGIEAIAHVGGVGSDYAIISRLVTAATSIPSWIPGLIDIVGSVIIGPWATIAETRTHYHSMLRYNSMFKSESKQTNQETN